MWIEEPGAYIGMPFHKRHITHFAESINLLLLKLMAPTEFPTVSVLSCILCRLRVSFFLRSESSMNMDGPKHI